MIQFTWIKMSSFVFILLAQFTVAIGQKKFSFTVRAGHEVTLPCENVIKNQDKCNGTTWLSTFFDKVTAEELISHGKIKNQISKARSERLSVTENCFLAIKKVTREDVGRYTCRQFNKSGKQQGADLPVFLSVINITEHNDNENVILYCTVLTYGTCEHTVEWLYDGNNNEVEISPRACSATVSFTPHLHQKSKYYELLKCNVTDKKNGKEQLYNVDPPSSFEKTGSTSAGEDNTTTTVKKGLQWWYITVAAVTASLLAAIIVVIIIKRKRTKERKTQVDENNGLRLNPSVTQPGPDTSQDMADPEDGVSYASISYTKVTGSKAQTRCKGDDDEDAVVTYSTLKAPSSSAAPAEESADLNLYAAVKKANK